MLWNIVKSYILLKMWFLFFFSQEWANTENKEKDNEDTHTSIILITLTY